MRVIKVKHVPTAKLGVVVGEHFNSTTGKAEFVVVEAKVIDTSEQADFFVAEVEDCVCVGVSP